MNMLNRRNFVLGLLSSSLIFNQSKVTFGHDNSSNLDNIEQYKSSEDVLIIVDMQNDFCPGGTLPVKNGDKVVEVINRIQKKFQYIILTQDWHPEDHSSFVTTNPQKEVFDKILHIAPRLWIGTDVTITPKTSQEMPGMPLRIRPQKNLSP